MRTLKYFGIQAEKLIGFVAIMGILYGVFFGAMLSESRKECISMVINYIILMAIITIIIIQSSLVRTNMPLALTMGGGRKEIFWGAQWTTALLIAQVEIFYFLSKRFLPQSSMSFLDRSLLSICIAGGALSELIAILVLKFGNKGIITGAVGGMLAGIYISIAAYEHINNLNVVFLMISDYFDIILFLSVVILYIVLGVIYYYQWKRYELRAF